MRRFAVVALIALVLGMSGGQDGFTQSETRSGDWVLGQEELAQGQLSPYQEAAESFLTHDLGDGTPKQLTYRGYAQYLSPVKQAELPFNGIGARWSAQTPDGSYLFLELRVSDDGAIWSGWIPAAELDQFAGEGSQTTDLVLAGGTFLQFRLTLLADDPEQLPTVQQVHLSYVDSSNGPTLPEPGRYRTAAVAQPLLITRASWGANEGYRYRNGVQVWPPSYSTPKKLIIHHTAGTTNPADPAATIRAIYFYHAVTLGWGDIGYNYIVDASGRVFEGRYGGTRSGQHVTGGHARQFNPGSIGICAIGNFMSNTPPETMVASLASVVAYHAQLYGIDTLGSGFFVSKVMANVSGHRDYYTTACPGDKLYSLLPSIRERAAQIIAGGGGSVPPPGSINSAAGGTVTVGGAKLVIPAGATTSPTFLSVKLEVAPVPEPVSVPEGFLPGSAAYTVTVTDAGGAVVSQLARSLQLTVPYQPSDLQLAGNNPNRVHLNHFNEAAATWYHVPDVTDTTAGIVRAITTKTGRFAIIAEPAAPTNLVSPTGAMVLGMDTSLSWTNPAGTAQYQIQVLPANLDGPAINLIVGRPDLVQAARFHLPSPVLGTGPYVMLPGMTYTWRVRTSVVTTPLGETDPGWSKYVSSTFRTYAPASTGISPAGPAPGSTTASRVPTLRWTNADPYIFYYELQLSTDSAFRTDPATATAAVYQQLIHGGMTNPLNSWTVPAEVTLAAAKTYYWRVRPRVQGDGTPVTWSKTWSFRTP